MKVLAISPHTDDAELGAGGTMARLVEEGHELHWVVFSSARESVPDGHADDVLVQEQGRSAEALGLPSERLELLDLPVRRFPEHRQEILEKLVALRGSLAPDLVLAPTLRDVHQDHEVVAQEAVRAFKGAASLAGYELSWNQMDSAPNLFVRLERRHLDRKLALLASYASQVAKLRPYFDPEVVTSHARVRGLQCGATWAEAFELVRAIV